MATLFLALSAPAGLLCAGAVSAQTSKIIPLLPSPVVVDGSVTEEAWEAIAPVPVVMFAPEYGGAMTERTEIRFAHDGEHLYASARFFDSTPEEIRANGLVRDDDAEDDFFNVVIDTFHDRESAVWFLVTPRGNRVDGAITDNAEGPGWNHVEYDSFWDASAVITDEGWSAEMRIPFSSLRFNRAPDGRVQMGLIAGRYISRKSERHVFPDIRPGPAVAQYKPSLGASVVLDHVQPMRPLYVRPYALGGFENASVGTGGGHDLVTEVGGDIKLGVSNDITLDLSVNTDFAQTEVDDQRVNLTRYSLLFPEKRAFFLERSGTFALDAGEDIRLFHSRRIGLHPTGEPLRVYGGARLVGRVGEWDIGALNMHTAGTDSLGKRNAGVMRVRRDVLGPESYLGGILTTSHTGVGGLDATVGLDGLLRIVEDDFLTVAFAATTYDGEGGDLVGQSLVRARWERRNLRGWGYRADFVRIGSAFRPALGFVPRAGLTTTAAAVGHGWFGGRTFQSNRVELNASHSRRHEDGGTEAAQIGVSWQGERRGGGLASADVAWRHEGVVEPFALGRSVIPEGMHRFVESTVTVETPKGRRLRGALSVSGGQFFDGYRFTGSLTPTWAVSPFIELGAHNELNRVWFPSRESVYEAWVNQLRVRISPNTQLSLRALLQHNSATDGSAANVRVRYTIRDGDDVFLVFTTGSVGSLGGTGYPDAVETTQRLLLKYSATIR